MFEKVAQEFLTKPEEIQSLASDPSCSVYLSASAGTGKTKVLIDRYLRILLEKGETKKILCLTFTNAASTEMRLRIMQKLEKWSICDFDELKSELSKLSNGNINELALRARSLYKIFSDEIDDIKIQTVHSFCLDILKKHSTCENSYYSYEIIEEQTKKKLFKSAFEYIFNSEQDEDLQRSINKLISFYDYERLEELVHLIISPKLQFIKYLEKFSDEEHLKLSIYNKHGATPKFTGENIIKQAILSTNEELLSKAATILMEEGEKLGERLLKANKDFTSYKKLFLKIDGEPYSRLVKASFAKKYPEITEMLQKEQARIYETDQEYKKYISAELCFAITLFSKRIFEIYENLKTEEQLFEYDDLIIKTIDLLQNSESSYWILYKLDMAIDHILVDEAQDLSEIQWELIKLISDEFFSGIGAKEYDRTIFIVGDFKQSIYSFQGAEPEEFEAARNYFASKVSNALKQWKELNMSISFRTTAPILEFVDTLLGNHCHFASNYSKHIPYRDGDGYIEVMPLIEKYQDIELQGWNLPQYEEDTEFNRKKKLAEQIAAQIEEWLSERRLLYGHLRKIEPKDIMILLRKRSDLLDYLITELKKRRIPVVDHEQSNLQENLLIQDFLSLIKFINLQSDDYNLACLLKSPIIGITEEQLFNVAYSRESSLWDNLLVNMPQVHRYLSLLLNESSTYNIFELINKILYIDNKYQACIARYGDGAADLINLFLEATIKFEELTLRFSPYQEFVEWFKDYNAKCTNSSFGNKVRIMTVHGAKGLQAPIVFLADSASSEQSPHENIYWSEDKELFFSCYSEFDCEVITNAKAYYTSKQLNENMRLLYVALTRAEDELYICGWENNRLKGSWYDIISKTYCNKTEAKPCFTTLNVEETAYNQYKEILTGKAINLARKQIIRPSLTKGGCINSKYTERGTVIHKLLHELPQLPRNRWEILLSPHDNSITKEVIETIEAFPHIFFSEQAISEVPISGEVNGQLINAQIDKIIFTPNLIQVIDFKTDTKPNINQIRESYRQQLQLYKDLLQKKHINTNIKAYILFSTIQEFIEILNIT